MKHRSIIGAAGAGALGLMLWFCFKPSAPLEGFSAEEVSQIKWELNAPLLFRSASWHAIRTFPEEIWNWRSKNADISKIEKQDDGSIHVCVENKEARYFYLMRKGAKGWEFSGIGEW